MTLGASLMRNKSGRRVGQKRLVGSEAGWWSASLGAAGADQACPEWVERKGGAKRGCDRRVKRDRSW